MAEADVVGMLHLHEEGIQVLKPIICPIGYVTSSSRMKVWCYVSWGMRAENMEGAVLIPVCLNRRFWSPVKDFGVWTPLDLTLVPGPYFLVTFYHTNRERKW